MKAVFSWIVLNPNAVKSYLACVLALIAKFILAATGKSADLGQWAGFVDQAVDVVAGGLAIYGLFGGLIHTARGPSLTSTDHVAAIVAAIAPAPVPVASAQVKSIVAEVVAQKPLEAAPPPDYPMPSRRF